MRALLIASPLLLTACAGEKITVNAPPPPREWLQCAPMPETPDLERLEVVRHADGQTFYIAEKVNGRDGEIARYIIALRGAHFDCANALRKVREYYDGVE